MRAKKRDTITNAVEIMDWRFFAGRPERIASLNQTRREMALGLKIRRVREDSGMTQAELAKRIGTQTSAISRIEDADYDRHSVQTLTKVADALGMRLIIDIEPKTAARKRAKLA
jgi:ribosome-binding protein aMBF1 (putative translation factor)